MAVYSIYKYELSQISALEAMTICDGSKETPLSLAQEVFGEGIGWFFYTFDLTFEGTHVRKKIKNFLVFLLT